MLEMPPAFSMTSVYHFACLRATSPSVTSLYTVAVFGTACQGSSLRTAANELDAK